MVMPCFKTFANLTPLQNIKKIFVGGLKDGIEDKDLEDYFGAFGRIISVEQVQQFIFTSYRSSVLQNILNRSSLKAATLTI
jgi:RNA recognition motif-containing protein